MVGLWKKIILFGVVFLVSCCMLVIYRCQHDNIELYSTKDTDKRIIEAIQNLKDRKYIDAYFIIIAQPSDRYIQFSGNLDGEIIYDFPIRSVN